MRVLHYTLGFPPYRSGGLTKYALDLMLAEQALGLDVCALYPGSISFVKSKCTVIKKGDYRGIQKFEIVNCRYHCYMGCVKQKKSMMNTVLICRDL